MKKGDRVRGVEDSDSVGTVVGYYDGRHCAMNGMVRVSWDVGGETWEEKGDLEVIE